MKKALSLFLVLVLLLSLCACGKDDAQNTAPSTEPSQTTTENTEAPTDGTTEGTQAPTAEPTTAPTAEPTETPTTPPTTQPATCSHSWKDATCTAPKTCSTCGATEGNALGHSWKDATCTAPKTCSICGATEGNALGHSWKDATCTAPKTCSTCGATDGAALGHDFVDGMWGGVCSRCYDREDWLYGTWNLIGLSEGYQFEEIDLQFWGYAALGFTTSEGWYSYQTPYDGEGTSEAITVSGNTVTIEFSNDGKSGTMVLQRTGMNELTVTSMTGDLFTADITSAINSVGKFTKTFFVNGEVSE